ncbi:uncharacterized protein LOC131043529 [Cryptomeria japonica]|uniref:uncharacterized protein LOC131043529 n=1 Tax=Cryptomeria japonica TaxID=3369 RepID=UPI0027DAAC51|nr:uncharacterized protein LOC131043529 [Cryptomeria japonica]
MQAPSNPNVVVQSHPFFSTNELENEPPLTRKRTKGPLETAFQNESRDIVDQDIERCICANGLAFNVVHSPYWKQMIKSVNEAPRGYKGPGYEKVHGTLLDKEVNRVEDALKPIRDSWTETGVTIVSDGWKDAKNRPLINVIAVSPKGAIFLKVVDCEGQVKDGQFIAEILISAIESVGPRNVVQVITDNARNCRAAGLLVEERYDHIFWTPCVVHSLNLMLQRIETKIKWIRDVYAEAEDIQMFITNHHMSQGIFRSFSNLEILKVVETCFASNTIVLRRLVKVRVALCNMVISNNWIVWKQSSSEKAEKIRERILNEKLWDLVTYLLSIIEPIMSMIRYTDMDRPFIGEIYDGIDSMLEKIKFTINAKENDPEEKFFK